jgi:hypothetical protein
MMQKRSRIISDLTLPSILSPSSSSSSLSSLSSPIRSSSIDTRLPFVLQLSILERLELNDMIQLLFVSSSQRKMVFNHLRNCSELYINDEYTIDERLLMIMMEKPRQLHKIVLIETQNEVSNRTNMISTLNILISQNKNTLRTINVPYISIGDYYLFNIMIGMILWTAARCHKLETINFNSSPHLLVNIDALTTMTLQCSHLQTLDINLGNLERGNGDLFNRTPTIDQISGILGAPGKISYFLS